MVLPLVGFCGAALVAADMACLKENKAMASCCNSVFVSSASDPVTMAWAVVAGASPTLEETKPINCGDVHYSTEINQELLMLQPLA